MSLLGEMLLVDLEETLGKLPVGSTQRDVREAIALVMSRFYGAMVIVERSEEDPNRIDVFVPRMLFTEDNCPGHVASNDDPMICAICGVHIDILRPD